MPASLSSYGRRVPDPRVLSGAGGGIRARRGRRCAGTRGLLSTVREKTAEALGRRPEAGLLLLHDLRRLHLAAAGNSLDWEMLAQAAQATGADDLLALATACHPQTLRQMRWTNTLIKTHSPQLLASAP
ncbi:hypothetical protein [Streptomyces sp. SLBN-31]|uniref:hypothetical protein n=1 Tax=Streptomyces sp. SLBN-31 TaxID=2768444 RepID=UPI0011692CF2|nr:hypothetical protein [Streptomyces sp. SLBN-31]TQJ75318.1 hypothetical protein FBY22_8357 [Streptomyces sp. SLBN-31]